MKKQVMWICLLLVVTVCIQSSRSADPNSWGGSLGATYWYPEWTNDNSDFESDTSGIYGPVAFLYYGKLGVGIQYYSGDFDLEFPGSISDISADRSDLDLSLSYRIADIFQISVLYKEIQYNWEQAFEVESEISGFGIGGGFNKVFPSGLLVYGFGYYLPELDYDQNIAFADDITGDADGFWVEGGLGYIIPDTHLLAKLGYRFQSIDIESDAADWNEETSGIRVDICYYF